MTDHHPDTLALASMIADHLRGTPIDVRDLPPTAWELVAAYVAQHDHGATGAAGTTGATFMGNPLRARFTARGPDGKPLPALPRIVRGQHRVIDTEPGAAPGGTGMTREVGTVVK